MIATLSRNVRYQAEGLFRRRHITHEMALRIFADAVLLNAALALALTARFLWSVAVEMIGEPTPQVSLMQYKDAYFGSFWLLTLTCIAVFYVSGFYTYGRTYRGRYKAFAILQAVSLSYLIFGCEILLLRGLIAFPRTVLLIGWFLTLVFLGAARLWIFVWLVLAKAGQDLVPAESAQGRVNNVLVIGGAGYIGSALTHRLLESGYTVRVLDLLIYGDESIADCYDHPRFELVRGDFRHVETVVRAAKGMDAIVHLGAIVGDSACQLYEGLTVEINLQATRTIAEVGKGFGVRRFVFASTCSVYGASDEVLDERSALRPLSLYARTKVESEKVLLSLADGSFAPTILRFATIYGLSGRPRFDLVVNVLAAKAIQEGEIGIYGGTQWRPLVHVNDVANAIALTLEAPQEKVCGKILNVGSNEQNYQIADLGNLVKQMMPAVKVTSHPVTDPRNYRVRFDRIAKELHFHPQYTVRDGVAEIMAAFLKGTITDYKDPRYSNSDYIKQHSELPRTLLEDTELRSRITILTTAETAPA